MTTASDKPAARPTGSVLVNLTPHRVSVWYGDRRLASWPPSGRFARVTESSHPAPDLVTAQGPIPVVEIAYGSTVDDLPEPAPGTLYLVSRVLAAAVDRPDLLFPSDEVRDDSGQIIGCRALGRFASAIVAHEASASNNS